MDKYDIVVVGGGFSGCAAAISAARQSNRVLLIEKANSLGGAANINLVNPFMRFSTTVNNQPISLSRGIFEEILNELEKMGGLYNNKKTYGVNIFNEEYLKLILNRMVIESGADILLRSYLTEVSKENGHIVSVRVANKSGYTDIKADIFIDCTGDADLAYLAGCPFRLGRESDNLCQPMTLCFRVGNVDVEKYNSEIKNRINDLYAEYKERGLIKNPREDVLIFRNVVNNILHFNSTRIVKSDPTNVFDLTKAEIEAREQVFELFNFLRDNFEAFKNSELIFTAPEIGVRESRMIDGEYILTKEDIVSCVKFEDSVAIGNYDIDIHNPEGSGTSHYYFNEGEYYSIPYRCLIPKGVDNMLVAGRCISVDHETQASIRIMPIVCCLGEAAGNAASVAIKEGLTPKKVDFKKIQALLRDNNALYTL